MNAEDERIELFDGASVPTLVEFLEGPSPKDRADAACALGDRLRAREISQLDIDTREVLAGLLEDTQPLVCFEAAITLAEIQDTRATPVLLRAMAKRSLRLDAVRALGTMGDPSAVEPLRKLLRRRFLPWADRMQAAAALCALGDMVGADYLLLCSTSRKRIERGAALHFIAESRHPRAREILEGVLHNLEDPLRDVAARSLGVLRDPHAAASLQKALEHAVGDFREDIVHALEQISAASIAVGAMKDACQVPGGPGK